MPRRRGLKQKARTAVVEAVVEIQGQCDPWFSEVQEVFREHFARGLEQGAAVCVIVDGRTVVDLWAGQASGRDARPWQANTLVNLYSATKGIAALCLHLLVEQGRIDLSAPVARYWPEFGAQGKGEISVLQLLSHQAGLAALAEKMPAEAQYDQDRIAAALAAQAPDPAPGTAHGYHAKTFGYLVAELVRRVSGRSLGAFLRDEVTGPREIDFWVGLPASEDARVAHLTRPLGVRPPAGQPDLVAVFQDEPESLTARAFANPPSAPGVVNTRAYRAAELPHTNGHGHARSLAQLYGALLGVCGTPLLSPSALTACYEAQVDGLDQVLRMRTRFAAGYLCSTDTDQGRFGAGSSAHAFGHPGMGGSLGCADPQAGLAFGYTMNRAAASILVDPRAAALLDAAYRCL